MIKLFQLKKKQNSKQILHTVDYDDAMIDILLHSSFIIFVSTEKNEEGL